MDRLQGRYRNTRPMCFGRFGTNSFLFAVALLVPLGDFEATAQAGLQAALAAARGETYTPPPPPSPTWRPLLDANSAEAPIASPVPWGSFGFRQPEMAPNHPAPAGYLTQELWVDTPFRWLSAQIRIELDEGTIYQKQHHGADVTVGRPHANLLADEPMLAFDTHVGLYDDEVFAIGGAINLGATLPAQSDETTFHLAWSSAPGQHATGQLDLGRFTLSDDAVGRAAVLLSSGTDDGRYQLVSHLVNIDGGRLSVGEPILHGLGADFQPLPPPPPPEPSPIILRGMTPSETTTDVVGNNVRNSHVVDGVGETISAGTPAPEPASALLVVIALLAVAAAASRGRTPK